MDPSLFDETDLSINEIQNLNQNLSPPSNQEGKK